jgi:hypothetical protein
LLQYFESKNRHGRALYGGKNFVHLVTMTYNTLFLILISLIATFCTNEEQTASEKWQVSHWEAAVLCSFPYAESEHPIVEALMGLDDTTNLKTELLLQNTGSFIVVKNGEIILSGDWRDDQQKLYLNTINEEWFFEVIIKNKDSLLLRSETTITMADLYLTLKR